MYRKNYLKIAHTVNKIDQLSISKANIIQILLHSYTDLLNTILDSFKLFEHKDKV